MRGRALLDAALPALLEDIASNGEDVQLVLDDYRVVTDPDLRRSGRRYAPLTARGRLYLTVRAWEDQAFAAVVEPDEEGRLAVGPPYLHHVAHAIGPVDGSAMYAQPVTDARSHDGSPRWSRSISRYQVRR